MTPADVLDAAADLIERDGWWNGVGRGSPGHCPVTAVKRVTSVSAFAALKALADHVGVGADEHVHRVVLWNDAQDGPDKVVWTMRQVAADLREGGG